MTENEAMRLTTDKKVTEMGMYELAHNCCYIKDGLARYRDFEMDMDARDFARNLMTTLANEDMPLDDDLFDEEIMENLMYDPFSVVGGLIALFYRNLWAMADIREHLKEYESIGTIEEFKALKEKSEPKKAKISKKHHEAYCPICKELVADDEFWILSEYTHYCEYCGQAILGTELE